MKLILLKDLTKKENLLKTRDHLEKDGLIIYPTDTLYGIGCNFYSQKAQKKIDNIKKRYDIPYSVIVSGIKMFNTISGEINPEYKDFIKKLFPGKSTLIVKLSSNVNRNLVKGGSTIGIRIPAVDEILTLIKFLDFPIITTSVNISSSKSLNKINKIYDFVKRKSLDEKIIIINGGDLTDSKGSTILDISGGETSIIREGDDIKRVIKLTSELNI